jgi:hypothetical protein
MKPAQCPSFFHNSPAKNRKQNSRKNVQRIYIFMLLSGASNEAGGLWSAAAKLTLFGKAAASLPHSKFINNW